MNNHISKFPLPSKKCIGECHILVVGDVMLDRYWHGDVGRISPEAPVPVVHIRREECRLGGAANVALNVKTLGGQVTLLSMAGQDDAANTLRQLLTAQSIRTELGEHPGMETTVKLRVLGRSQQVVRIDFEKEPDQEMLTTMSERFDALLELHDVVLFSDYGKGVLTNVQRMIKLARKAGKPVLVDPKGSNWDRYRGASIITPNRTELGAILGSWSSESQMQEMAQELRRKLELHALLVTRSEEGMTLFEEGKSTSVLAEARELADITGAGDTVIATMALLVASGMSVRDSMAWANRAGGLVVAKFGTASLTYEELDEKIKDAHG